MEKVIPLFVCFFQNEEKKSLFSKFFFFFRSENPLAPTQKSVFVEMKH